MNTATAYPPWSATANDAHLSKRHFNICMLQDQCPDFTAAKLAPLDHFEIILISEGAGTLSVDTRKYELTNRFACCVVPGQMRVIDIAPGTQGFCISFSMDMLYRIGDLKEMMHLFERSVIDRTLLYAIAGTEEQMEMAGIVNRMIREWHNDFQLKPTILAGLLNTLLIYFIRLLEDDGQTRMVKRETELVRQFMELLKQHFITQKKVACYAAALHVTPNYLNRAVKHVTGFTASHHIQQQVILEAKRQFIYYNTSMKQIAYFLGFESQAHFSKFFKANTGMCFSSFKKDAVL
ncbi:AraC family transcriptional regulator [Deminuibacter soli]|uniref:AraC family transcriptional regulator n=1 Tax=Deminuibacter soli TaxID=2291815 RepID=A0A3E1NPB2_9BACT|nr:helix-turn-helix transcriptional regulator [Deminuibacter soli]RFM29664.1 AraC family transcriptional regulator [Deminuibacter soli]